MTDSFGARLRAHRERKRIGLTAIAHETKIKVSLFEALERDDASAWPSGIFRRAFIRAYAKAIGLDPEPVVREFLQRFPDPADDPPAALCERIAPTGDLAHEESSGLRLTLDDSDAMLLRIRPRLLTERSQRLAAAACDACIVLAVGALAFLVTGRFWTPVAIASVACSFGGIVACGSSVGVWLVSHRRGSAPKQPAITPIPIPAVRRRDAAAAVRPFEARAYDKAVYIIRNRAQAAAARGPARPNTNTTSRAR